MSLFYIINCMTLSCENMTTSLEYKLLKAEVINL